MLAGENKPFPPLTSASPRLLFDFLPALMSPMDGEKTPIERRRAKISGAIEVEWAARPCAFLSSITGEQPVPHAPSPRLRQLLQPFAT